MYVLLNSVEFDKVWDVDIRPPSSSGSSGNTNLDIVFVIDYSASMYGNDSSQMFKTLSRNFVSKLRDGKDRGAVVKFVDSATVVSGLTTDKAALIHAINGIEYDELYPDGNGGWYSKHGTDGSTGLHEATQLLMTSSSGYRYIVFLTDGKDEEIDKNAYSYDGIIARAKADGIVIYTIGLGTVDEDLLKKIASGTQGKYYHATASEISGELLDLDKVYEEIESEVIDMTTDSNNDGINDYFTSLLDDGTLTINGVAWWSGVLSMNFPDSSDWDGDGLKNGEELIVSLDAYTGKPYVHMKSDPLLKDTDDDGFTDYQEVREMGTSPLKFTIAGDEAIKLIYDSNFPQVYQELSTGEQWIQNVFDGEKDKEAKIAFIEYFSDYASNSDIMSRNAEMLERQMILRQWRDGFAFASNVITLGMNTMKASTTLIGGNYSFGGSAEKLREAASKITTNMTGTKNLLLAYRNSEKEMNAIAEGIKNVLEAQDNCNDAIDLIVSNKNYLDEISDDKTLKSNDVIFQSLPLVLSGLDSIPKAVATLHNVKISWGVEWGKNFSDMLDSTGVIGGIVTVVIDGVEMAQDLIDVYMLYGRIQANYAEYQKYLELLRRIERHSPLDYIRGGAAHITDMFNDATNEPDWQKFNQKVNKAENQVIVASGLKMMWHTAIAVAGILGNPWLGVADAALSTAKGLLDQTDLVLKAHAIVAARIYHSIVQASLRLFTEAASFHEGYFEANGEYLTAESERNKEEVVRYLAQAAQARIVGLDTVREYLLKFKIESLIDQVLIRLVAKNLIIAEIIARLKQKADAEAKAEIKVEYAEAISGVYETVKNLQREFQEQLSENLPGYPDDYLK